MTRSAAIHALKKLKQRDFEGWAGLAPETTLRDIETAFGPIDEEPRPRLLGSKPTAASWVAIEADGFNRGLVVYFGGRRRVLLVEGEDPQIKGGARALLDSLGEPVARLDSYVDMIQVKGNELVYVERGLTLYVTSDYQRVTRAAVFVPTTVADYQARLRLDLQMRPRPLPRWMGGHT